MTQDGSIERCQVCGITLARRGSDGFTCDHCLKKAIRDCDDKARHKSTEDKTRR